MPKSAKDQCFEDALNAHQDATGEKLPVKSQQPWVQDKDGTWGEVPPESTFGSILGSILKTLGIQNGNTLPRAPGVPNPVQVRYPDLTVTTPDGKQIVIDNKFTDKNGKPDPWRTQPGTNGKTQQEDYNDINNQNTKNPNDQNLSLNKDNCKCGDGEPQPENVPVPVPSMSPFTVPIPGVNPVNPTVPEMPGLPEFPGLPGFGIPVFG